MKRLLVPILFLSVQSIFAQSKLPLIKATSKSVAINDDGHLDKNAWSLSPGARPDVYTADRSRKPKWVTFYTDIDSIRVKVKPGTKFNFVVLLNGKDSCFTQIASAIRPENEKQNATVTHDTIPFTITEFNTIKVQTIINSTDTLNLHFDLSSFDIHLTRDAILKKTKLLSNQPDALSGKAKPNFNKMNKAFTLQMGNLVLKNQEINTTNITAHDMDGRFGWNLFEGKTVEIDYDKDLLIIHSKKSKVPKGYVKSKIGFARSYPYVEGTFSIGNIKYKGNFMMDTGSETAAILDSAWLSAQKFPKDLKLIKSTILHDPRGAQYQTNLVLAPSFSVNGFKLTEIPVLELGGKNPGGIGINFLGNDLLKRFNMILDFKNDYLYLKPNKLANVKYRGNS